MDRIEVGTQVRVRTTGKRGEVVELLWGGWSQWVLVLETGESDARAVAFADLQPWTETGVNEKED